MEKITFSRTKEKIAYMYTENSRRTYASIGKQIKKSPQYVRNMVQKFEEEKTLIPYPLVDYSFLGLIAFRVYFKGGFTRETELNKLLNYIAKNKMVTSVVSLSGAYDIQVDFLAENPSGFNKELKALVAERKELSNYDVVVNIVNHNFPKKYLTKETHNIKDYITGGDRPTIELDENQRIVLKELVQNPVIKIAKIADKNNLNIRTVISVKKKLEQRIIKGYKADINSEKIGYEKNRITLKLHNLSIELEKELLRRCLSNRFITKFSKTIGSWDIEIDVETDNIQKFRKIFLEIREEFKEIIQNFNYFSVLEISKRSYVPENYFDLNK